MQSNTSKKTYLGINVYDAAKKRISKVFDDFGKIYLSFSGGKDSSVMLHIAAEEARKRNRKIGLLFVDLEAQYKMTIDHVQECYDLYSDCIDPYWVALPINLRNAVSVYEPQWVCWDEDRHRDWVRSMPKHAIKDPNHWDWFEPGMEFEEFIVKFGEWYAGDDLCACMVGIRTQESLNRWRTISTKKKVMIDKQCWTTRVVRGLFNAYPIYDWKTEDIWKYVAKNKKPYNILYDRMHASGLTINQARICQPYGDDQRKGLCLFQAIEPETWARVVARVNGANQGSLYAQESGNILGRIKVTKPEGHTWKSFAKLLLSSMPQSAKEHYEGKIMVFLKWYEDRGYPSGIIPDEHEGEEKASPSWQRICKTLLRNDYWCKGLSFSQHKSEAFAKYQKLNKRRREEWKTLARQIGQ